MPWAGIRSLTLNEQLLVAFFAFSSGFMLAWQIQPTPHEASFFHLWIGRMLFSIPGGVLGLVIVAWNRPLATTSSSTARTESSPISLLSEATAPKKGPDVIQDNDS
ncbi:hypothetical protein AMS68_001786 [Peltaster fructicola]|uniref:Uncharacterized protein n=1 Tax=Peltaster fructicola TaxID=286661 RepID=A0A6H0XNR4_9PEZI|nr:hypothetical protein AMS68_001786 [Peltaster fructicola]